MTKEEIIKKKQELEQIRDKVQQQFYQVSGAIAVLEELLNPPGKTENSPPET